MFQLGFLRILYPRMTAIQNVENLASEQLRGSHLIFKWLFVIFNEVKRFCFCLHGINKELILFFFLF